MSDNLNLHSPSVRWGEKRYHSLDFHLRSRFGEKVYRIALNGGMTCPNRDGHIGTGGCIFCSADGSGDFAGRPFHTISQQLAEGKMHLLTKRPVHSYIAYFQAFTNTYAPVSYLESIFTEAIEDPDVKILSVATRPDCLGDDVIDLLKRLNQIKPVWVELGLQTIHPETVRFIRRGYETAIFDQAVQRLRGAGIEVIVHVILYLPGETEEMMLKTIEYLNRCDIQGIKLQLLHILEGTDLADIYREEHFYVPDMETYIRMLGQCISHLRPDIVIHRLTGDGPKNLLIAPLWTGAKRSVLNRLHQYLKENDIWQGKEYHG
ncbi:TIGR01212 family radical SAM protein [Mediterraneibacter catenae]|uniref:TIGR01212 family radical SAM protein n=1 Tax=Mediterraneibacter catenae TaxID=2594882 RepID=A0A5M9I0F4_9FIRM|nr:TIGR01212 family radical SAM protein [Mediterraneibacter catenae]KAA8502437.1 TIGR01212 family radical SAM protein [Mediterraneibacter catenae]